MSTKAGTDFLTSFHVRQALKEWHSDSNTESPLAMLYQFRKLYRETGHTPRHITNRLLLAAMDAMKQHSPAHIELLQLRFMDQDSISQLAHHYSVAESTMYKMQQQALQRLTATLRELEEQACLEQKLRLLRRLEASTYGELVGVQPHIEQLLARLREPHAPWLVAIEGLGGIGKTSLADAVMRRLIDQIAFDEIGWMSARQNQLNLGGAITVEAQPALTAAGMVEALAYQLLPALNNTTAQGAHDLLPRLRKVLKQTPHVIVIDNLETLVDVESLLPTLHDLANPSKFLLTSRQSLYATPNIYHFTVPELSEANALHLIRREAANRNLPTLATAPDHALLPIYATVGGNPLALRLVVGQTHIYPLASILDHLRKAQGQTAENLYTYIYRRAWDGLDVTSQDVLLVMPLVNPYGDDIETIAEVGGLETDVVWNALNHLVTLNLVDVRGDHQERRYSIHGLTRTFLHEQVLQWQ